MDVDETRPKKSVSCTVRMTPELDQMLREHCERTGQSKTVAVERALLMYIEHMKECFS